MEAGKFHFRILTWSAVGIVVLPSIFSLPLLAVLSSDPSLLGLALNYGLISTVLVPLGLILWGLQNLLLKDKSLSISQAMVNTQVFAVAFLAWFYAWLAFLFNWPINLEKTTPEYLVNREIPLGISLGLTFVALVIWVGWARPLGLERWRRK